MIGLACKTERSFPGNDSDPRPLSNVNSVVKCIRSVSCPAFQQSARSRPTNQQPIPKTQAYLNVAVQVLRRRPERVRCISRPHCTRESPMESWQTRVYRVETGSKQRDRKNEEAAHKTSASRRKSYPQMRLSILCCNCSQRRSKTGCRSHANREMRIPAEWVRADHQVLIYSCCTE